MPADIPTRHCIWVPWDQPYYHVGAWWRRGRLSGKGRLHGESHVWAFLKEQKVPRGRWERFQAKGGACAKPKWHDLRVSWGGFKRKPPEKIKMWGRVCRALCTASWVTNQSASANGIYHQHLLPPILSPWHTPNFSCLPLFLCQIIWVSLLFSQTCAKRPWAPPMRRSARHWRASLNNNM